MIMNSVRHTLHGLAIAALALSLVAVPADASARRKHKAAPVAAAAPVAPTATPGETPEQQRVRLNAEQAATAKAQNDKNAAAKAAYEAQVAANKAAYNAAAAQHYADVARQKTAEAAAHAKWLAVTVPCKNDPEVRCAKPAKK